MTKQDIISLCLIVLGFALFGALGSFGLADPETEVLKSLAKGASAGSGTGFLIWFFILR